MNSMRLAFDKAYIKELSKIRALYSRSGLFFALRYRVGVAIIFISSPLTHDEGIRQAQNILKLHRNKQLY